jgi:hypothetical protein
MLRPPVGRRLAIAPPVAALVVAQSMPRRPEVAISAAEELAAAVLFTLVVGGGLILLAPDYTDRATRRVLDEPIEALLYGVGIGLVVAIATGVLLVTVVGVLLAAPMVLVVLVLSVVGYLAVGRAVTDNWAGVLLVGIGASAVVAAVPIVGGLLGLVVGSFGLGAAYLEARGDTRTRPDRPEGAEPTSDRQ